MRYLKFALAGLVLLASNAYAGDIDRHTTYGVNSQVTSTTLNGNQTAIENVVNGGLDNDNADTSSGFRFYEALGSLPSAATQGRLIFNTAYNGFYFDTGSLWKSVHPIDLDGDTQIQVEETADEDIIRFDTNGTEVMAISKAGEITKPLQPSFLVHPASAQDDITHSTDVTVIWGTEIFDLGGDFASNTFTAPITGKYLLCATLDLAQVDIDADYVQLQIVTSNKTYYSLFDPLFSGDPVFWYLTRSVVADMDAADTAVVKIKSQAGASQVDIGVQSTFSGSLIN